MTLQAFYASGHVVDLVLAVMALEFAVLTWRSPSDRRASRAVDLGLAMAPGACLLLALRGALTGGSWTGVALWLTAALPFHVGDLARRRPSPGPRP